MRLPIGLDVRSWVARRGGSHRGHIELRGAQACAGHGTTHREPAARTHPHPPPHVQPVAPVWQRHGRCRLRTPKDVPLVVPARAPPRPAGHPGVASIGGNAIRAHEGLVTPGPPAWSSWRLLTRASPHGMLRGSDGGHQGLSHTRKRHTVKRRPWHPTRVPRRSGTCAACTCGRLQRRLALPWCGVLPAPGAVSCPDCSRWRRPGTTPPRKE